MFVCKWITVCLNSLFLICTEVKKNKFPDVIPPPACRGQRTPLIWMKGSKRFPVKYLFKVQNKTIFNQSVTRKRRREDARQFVFKSALWAVFSFTSGESRRFSIHTNTFLLRLFTCDVFDTKLLDVTRDKQTSQQSSFFLLRLTNWKKDLKNYCSNNSDDDFKGKLEQKIKAGS